uniref:S100/CaBP-9k-type calcium binding subdomain domain-containing protein n=1 Tax=Acanthochromis polyacanthus TaxID=80966 RepID=A0A3Q1H3K5_9TELE
MAGRLDDCMITLIQVFAEYASKDEDKGGDPNTLSKGELKELIQNELKSIVNVSVLCYFYSLRPARRIYIVLMNMCITLPRSATPCLLKASCAKGSTCWRWCKT